VKSDNIEYVPRWVFDKEATYTAADPLTVTPSEELVATRNRDGLLLGVAALVIVAVLAYLLGRAAS
jgi:hypothetical protein